MTKAWDSKLVREMLTRVRTDGGVINADDYRPEGLEKEFGMGSDGLYRLSDTQAHEILQMRTIVSYTALSPCGWYLPISSMTRPSRLVRE